MTCPDPSDLDACLDQTPCPGCVATQDREWAVGSWSDNSTQRNSPADLAEDRAAADHLPTNPEGG